MRYARINKEKVLRGLAFKKMNSKFRDYSEPFMFFWCNIVNYEKAVNFGLLDEEFYVSEGESMFGGTVLKLVTLDGCQSIFVDEDYLVFVPGPDTYETKLPNSARDYDAGNSSQIYQGDNMSKQYTSENMEHETVLKDGTKFKAREIDAFTKHVKSDVLPVYWVHRVSREGTRPLAKFEGVNAKAHADEFARVQNAAYAPHDSFYRAEVSVKPNN